jgi:hypothetical protein
VKEILLKRGLVCGIAILFLGLCITSGTGVDVEQTSFPLNRGPLAWWKFDEGSGTTAGDSSGHGYDGTVVGATWTDEGLSFDGTNDYVEFDAHSLALGINKTDNVDVFIRFKTTGYGMLYSMSHTNPERPYFDLSIDEDGKVGIRSGDITCVFELFTDHSFNNGEWHTFKCEYRGDPTNPTVNLFVDSVAEGTKTDWVCPQIDEDYETVKVGRNSNTEEDYFDGEIDDIQFFKNLPDPGDAPFAPTITGPQKGNVGETYSFTFNAVDPDGDDVKFYIDWGNGKESTVYVGSGVDKTVDHSWTTAKTYTIKAYAEDDENLKGPVGTFQVVIPRNKVVQTNPFLKFLQNHPNMFPILKYVLGL